MGDKSPPLEGSNQPLMDEFFKELRRGREKWMAEGETFCKWHTYNSFFLHERVRAFQFLASNDLWHPSIYFIFIFRPTTFQGNQSCTPAHVEFSLAYPSHSSRPPTSRPWPPSYSTRT